jgi:hypothetical protein
MKAWRKWWEFISGIFIVEEEDRRADKIDDVVLINEAKYELYTARHIFKEMEDPDMVDWAVYNVFAAEKRYNYLLKIYRQKHEPGLSEN